MEGTPSICYDLCVWTCVLWSWYLNLPRIPGVEGEGEVQQSHDHRVEGLENQG